MHIIGQKTSMFSWRHNAGTYIEYVEICIHDDMLYLVDIIFILSWSSWNIFDQCYIYIYVCRSWNRKLSTITARMSSFIWVQTKIFCQRISCGWQNGLNIDNTRFRVLLLAPSLISGSITRYIYIYIYIYHSTKVNDLDLFCRKLTRAFQHASAAKEASSSETHIEMMSILKKTNLIDDKNSVSLLLFHTVS
jgi:hypothetical protein